MDGMKEAIVFGNIEDVKLNIPELKIDNYKVWKERILLQLRLMNIDYALTRDEPPSITENSSPDVVDLYEKWERSNHLSVTLIKDKISDSILDSVAEYTKVRDLFQAIDEQFAISDKALVSSLRKELSSRYIGSEGVRDYIMHMVDIAAKLKDFEIIISEADLVDRILCALPSHYGSFKYFYKIPRDERLVDELLTICEKREEMLKRKNEEKSKLAANSSSKKKKKGHIKKNIKEKKEGQIEENEKVSGNEGMKKIFKCFFCKKKGHKKKECNKFKAWLQKKGYDKSKESNEK